MPSTSTARMKRDRPPEPTDYLSAIICSSVFELYMTLEGALPLLFSGRLEVPVLRSVPWVPGLMHQCQTVIMGPRQR